MNSRAKRVLFFLSMLVLSHGAVKQSDAAMRFDLNAAAAVTTNSFVIDPSSTDFTFSAWATVFASVAIQSTFLSQNNGTGLGRNWLYLQPRTFNPATFLGGTASISASSVPVNVPMNIVLTKTGTSISIYVNGISVLSVTKTSESATGTLILANSKLGTQSFIGCFYQAQLYNRVLSPNEIKTMASLPQFNLMTTGSVSSYFFDEGIVNNDATGATVLDHSASRVNATASSSAMWTGNNALSYP